MKNNYQYNDKELFDDADLNWYDYGFRSYDPQVGRFTQLDPLTDDYPELTPYQYASNDPILNIDVDGLEGVPFNAVQTLGNVTLTATRVAHVASTTTQIISVGARVLVNITVGVLDIFANGSNSNVNQVGVPDQVRKLIKDGEYKDAATLILKSIPELNEPDLESYDMEPNQAGHNTKSKGRGKSATTFGTNVFQQYGWGVMSWGYFVRSIYHEIIHVRLNSEKIKKHSGWNGESEVIAYTEQYLNTTLPKFDPSKKAERINIQRNKDKLNMYYNELPKEGKEFYRKRYEDTINIMDELLKK